MKVDFINRPSFKAVYANLNYEIREEWKVKRLATDFVHQLSKKKDNNFDYFVSGIYRNVPSRGIGYAAYGCFLKVDKVDKSGQIVKTSIVKVVTDDGHNIDAIV